MSDRKALLYTKGAMWKFYAQILHQLLITSFVNMDMKFSYSSCFREVTCEILQKYTKCLLPASCTVRVCYRIHFFKLKRKQAKVKKKNTICSPCFICWLSFAKRRRENGGLSRAAKHARA